MDIRKWEYGNGPLFGYKDYKDYINDIQDCKCLLCGKNPIQYYHHIKKRSDGGSNKIDYVGIVIMDQKEFITVRKQKIN